MHTQKKAVGIFGKRSRKARRVLAVLLAVLALLGVFYCLFAFSSIPLFVKGRHILIETAMSTMRHQWIATRFFPESVVDEVMQKVEEAQQEQVGVESTWEDVPPPEEPELPPQEEPPSPEETAFFQLFHELDIESTKAYLKAHPEALTQGYERLYINEAGLDDSGTSILTNQGDQVLAVDAENGILLIRVKGTGFRGVLAIAKDPSQFSICVAETLGEYGQHAGTIARNNGGVLALTANAFEDYDEHGNPGKGNGGILSGYTMCSGMSYGTNLGWGWKRVEMRSDDRLYIVDAPTPVHEDCTDAAEFTPALIIDGKVLVDEYCGWNAINPRACLGQTDRGEIMMLCIEGRLTTSLGTGVVKCAEILANYSCVQGMNLDGGTSAIMWYRGEYVTRCSNTLLPYGRPVPNACVYKGKM